ncbi:MAG: galactokinase [Ruminococcus sp.]|nr:galactokinase [Ruminococcus sp.]
MKIQELLQHIRIGGIDEKLRVLYGSDETVLAAQRERYGKAVQRFAAAFPQHDDVHIFSAPGRSEIGGNHTDHQHGCALAAAVNLDAVAVVAFHDEGMIRLMSEGYGLSEVSLDDLSVKDEEKGNSTAIVRGIAARFAQMGVKVGGFDAYTVSDVLSGSGLSSSAAFETLIGTIIDIQYNDGKAGEIEIAKIGQYAENVYFGKGSGLLDQMVCSVGGFVFLDFRDTDDPRVEKHSFDFEKAGYNLCITDTRGSHSDLTDDYVAVPAEMKEVAAYFGKPYLREVDEKAFFSAIPELHGKVSDRAILRAIHFFGENRRAIQEADALERGDLERLFTLYRQSADSSANLLQNLYSTKKPLEQGIPLGIAVSKSFLGNDASVRVHGGGFAGTIQAFVPLEKTDAYREKMDALFGGGSCYVLRIRSVGGIKII